MRTKIVVATHKQYWMPADEVYLPVHAGHKGKADLGYTGDDAGENISEKNPTFCELTCLYWAWKNLDADVYGLCHYRRYLGNGNWWKPRKERLLNEKEIQELLRKGEIILPKKRRYWIETREAQYAHAHHIEDLRCVEGILSEKYPEYLADWKWMLQTRSGHICNMFITRKEHFDTYCSWLFDILFEAERRLDIESYSAKDRRVFGYLAERLLDVWIRKNGIPYTEVPVMNLERQHWIRKGLAFVQRKMKG